VAYGWDMACFRNWLFKYRGICFWQEIVLSQTLLMILMAGFIAWETDRIKPKPQALGNGDTLMVRVSGYDFCPKYCEVDHFHFGHKNNYNCEEDVCEHIIYENRHK